jgi:tetratricopeptide (TPR) repeat protein
MTIRAAALPRVLKFLSALLGAFLLVTLPLPSAVAQQAAPSLLIDSQLKAIQIEEQRSAPAERLGYLWATLGVTYNDAGDFPQSLAAYERALPLLAKDPAGRANYATALDNLGALYLEYERMEEAETARKKAWAIRKQIGEPAAIARSQEHLAEIALVLHHYKEAEKGSLAAYATLAAVPEPLGSGTVSTLLSALVTLTFAECMQPRCADGFRHAEQAMEVVRKVYPPESVELGHVLMALGFAQWKSGSTREADSHLTEGIRILRARLGERNRLLLAAMYEYRGYLQAMRRGADLAELDREMGSIVQQQASAGCTYCAVTTALSDIDPPFEQQPPDLIDHRSTPHNPSLS